MNMKTNMNSPLFRFFKIENVARGRTIQVVCLGVSAFSRDGGFSLGQVLAHGLSQIGYPDCRAIRAAYDAVAENCGFRVIEISETNYQLLCDDLNSRNVQWPDDAATATSSEEF